jgi:hypothetical protein
LGFHKLHYYPTLYNHFHKLKVFKEDCHDREDDYTCDEKCEDDESKDCKYKYVRKCYRKHNHKEVRAVPQGPPCRLLTQLAASLGPVNT